MTKKQKTIVKADPESSMIQARHSFSDHELIELGRVASREQSEIERLERELSSIKSDYKGKTESAEMRRNNAFQKHDDGFEMREVEAVAEFHCPDKGKKTWHKCDRTLSDWKGDIICVEEMTKADFQLELIRENPPVPFDSIKSDPAATPSPVPKSQTPGDKSSDNFED